MNATDTDLQTVKDFLRLPKESLPSAVWDDPAEDLGSAWAHLRDWMLPEVEQRMNHFGLCVRLVADRDGWRDGRVVTLA
jgi:hypothetical protein